MKRTLSPTTFPGLLSWIDREQEIVAVLMTQVRPYRHINIRKDFQVLVHQAFIE